MALPSLLALLCCYNTFVGAFSENTALPSQIEPSDIPNVHHIFNAIHSSMRQWGSSRNHNGMSFFLAHIPRGTQFYHGTGTPTPIEGMEWLAFEPEHALNFAFAFDTDTSPESPRKSPNILREDDAEVIADPQSLKWFLPHSLPSLHPRHLTQEHLGQTDDGHRPRPPKNLRPGWLHTYQTKQDLNLLYIDGMAAAKSSKGTLDSQDYLLLKSNLPDNYFQDWQRASRLCTIAQDRWSGRVDGFIRMEHGFEIVMCSFAKSLDVVRVTRTKHWEKDDRGLPTMSEQDFFAFFQVITARYHSIGGNRVTLDYDRFVSAFAYTGLDLFASPDAMPRLENRSSIARDLVVADVDKMMTDVDTPNQGDTNMPWQSIADEIVTRYATRLQNLVSGRLSNLTEIKLELERLLRVFIDYDDRDAAAEIQRCSLQFIPPERPGNHRNTSIGRRVVHTISEEICSTLHAAMNADNMGTAMGSIQALIRRLDWTVWKECPSCESNEICCTPIWPHGAVEDYKHPQCFNATVFVNRTGYWWERLP